jgi:hypothetical protein
VISAGKTHFAGNNSFGARGSTARVLRQCCFVTYNTSMSKPHEDVGTQQDSEIAALLMQGRAETAAAAERLYLEEHLGEIIGLVNSALSDAEIRRHPLVILLLSHGSRGWEDSIL